MRQVSECPSLPHNPKELEGEEVKFPKHPMSKIPVPEKKIFLPETQTLLPKLRHEAFRPRLAVI